ncbi:MAG: serine protease, partial [Clostridium sp.]
MKKTFLKTIISAGIVLSTIGTLAPLGVSAQSREGVSQWKQAADRTWSYYDGNNAVKGWKYISGNWYY